MEINFQAVFIGAERKVSKKTENPYWMVRFNDETGNILEVFAEKEFPMIQYKKYDCCGSLTKAFDKLNIKLTESKAM